MGMTCMTPTKEAYLFQTLPNRAQKRGNFYSDSAFLSDAGVELKNKLKDMTQIPLVPLGCSCGLKRISKKACRFRAFCLGESLDV